RVVFQDELGIWHEFIVENIDDTHEDVFVYCEDSFYETRGDYIDDRRFVNANFSTVADAVMSYTRWKLKIVDDIGSGTVNFYHTDVKTAVFEGMQNKFDFEIKTYVEITNSRISQRVIELRKQRGHDNGKRFTYDKDIDSISRTIDSTEFCTALYPYGKGEETENGGYGRRIDISKVNNGKKYVENTTAKEQFGKYVNGKREHIFGTYIFEDIDDRKKLLEQAKAKLEELSEFKVTYKCDVLVLNKLLEDRRHEGIELGDTVAIIDKDINIRVRARVVERKSYLNSTKADEIVLGNFIEDYATQQAKIKSDLKSISNTINEQGQAITDLKNFDYYATIVQELNDRINATGGYVYISKDGQGLITYDKPIDKNPTKAIQLKGGAIRIANSKKSDGTWNWTTFGTGDGFTADVINAGTLNANLVRTGILQDKNAKSFLNLDTGEFNFGDIIKSVDGRSIVEGAAIDEIDGDKIISRTVTESKIKDDAISESKIKDGAVSNTKIGNGAVDNTKLKDNAVSNSKIQSGAISNSKIQDDAIDGDKIAQNAVRGVHIQNAAITNAKIDNGAVTNIKIANSAIDRAKIKDGEITNAKIADAAITNAKIGFMAVDAASIQNGAINNAKIRDAAIDRAKIQDGEITNAKIADAAITNAKIGYGAIDSAEIRDGAITNAKIKDASIDSAKISSLSADKIYGGTINAKYISVENLDATNINRGQFSGNGFSCGVNGYGGTARFNGSSINFGANSGYVKIRDTGGRGEMKVDGTIAAIGHNYFVELNSGGLHLDNYNERSVQYSNAGIYLSTYTIIDGALNCTGGISTKNPVNCGRITVSGKTIIFEDGGKLSWKEL
ncbi:MAG: phage tail spike protein, partial [Finegoldia magna]|nr:phage tail spike protein [Finegoldia magna]